MNEYVCLHGDKCMYEWLDVWVYLRLDVCMYDLHRG